MHAYMHVYTDLCIYRLVCTYARIYFITEVCLHVCTFMYDVGWHARVQIFLYLCIHSYVRMYVMQMIKKNYRYMW